MWFHKYRYASFRPERCSSPLLLGRSFPIVRYKILGDKVKCVELLLQETPRIVSWYHWTDVILFECASSWCSVDGRYSEGLLRRLLRRYSALL